MAVMPRLMVGDVMHKRLLPKVNQFAYGVYYIAVPLSNIEYISDGWRFGVNRPGLLSFHNKDHGDRSGGDLALWARKLLNREGIGNIEGEIVLLTLPRVLGYVFNPVSFWLCYDLQGNIRAIICEVNNTFGESHCYICAHENGDAITDNDIFAAPKSFHVSPFLQREGGYTFRFSVKPEKFGVWIDFINENKNKQLLTTLTGRFVPATRTTIRNAFWRYPLVTLKAMVLIHAQAFKLFFKGIKYVPKPEPVTPRVTRNINITKN